MNLVNLQNKKVLEKSNFFFENSVIFHIYDF